MENIIERPSLVGGYPDYHGTLLMTGDSSAGVGVYIDLLTGVITKI